MGERVEGCVEEGGDPEEEELDEEGSVEFDVVGGVGGCYGCPVGLEGVHFGGGWGLVWLMRLWLFHCVLDLSLLI